MKKKSPLANLIRRRMDVLEIGTVIDLHRRFREVGGDASRTSLDNWLAEGVPNLEHWGSLSEAIGVPVAVLAEAITQTNLARAMETSAPAGAA